MGLGPAVVAVETNRLRRRDQHQRIRTEKLGDIYSYRAAPQHRDSKQKMWIKPDVLPVVGAVTAGVAAMFYTMYHSTLHYEDVRLSKRDRSNPFAEVERPRRFENLGHKHVESSFFRHWAEKHDAQLYNPRLHQQRMIFPAPWRMEQQQ